MGSLKNAFITVGSTKFDSLIEVVFTDKVLSALKRKGYTEVVVQCGNSVFAYADTIAGGEEQILQRNGVVVKYWKFKPSLDEHCDRADLVISHAGSGTILDVLRRGKPIIVVPNPALADNHQEELAIALAERGHVRTCDVSGLARTIEEFDETNLAPFPPRDGSRFAKILDKTMGFA